MPSVLEAPVLGRWEKTHRRESGPRSKAGWRTEGQSEPRAGPMVSMATRVPGGANNPVFQSSATSLGGERRSSSAPFEIFINSPGDASHERLASPSHNLAGPTRWAVTGPNEAWRQRGLQQPARLPWDTEQRSLQSVPSEQMETWAPAHPKAGRALAPPLSHAFPLARLPNARRCPAPVCGRGGRATSRFLLTEL